MRRRWGHVLVVTALALGPVRPADGGPDLAMPTLAELADAARSTLNEGFAPGPGLALLTGADGRTLTITSPSGCTAAAYRDASGRVVIAFQATRTRPQFDADLQILRGQADPAAFADALSFTRRVRAAATGAGLSNVFVTGHSLGGTLAEYVAWRTGLGGAAFAGSGVPGYVAAGGEPGAPFLSVVERGDPWANLASDAGERDVVAHADHVGRVVTLGAAAAARRLEPVVRDLRTLGTAGIGGGSTPAARALREDWDRATRATHALGLYTADLDRLGRLHARLP